MTALSSQQPPAHERVQALIAADRPYVLVHHETFDGLGWDLPDGGRAVRALADAAPGGAFDPRALEKLGPAPGFRAKWHQIRYPYYGVDWDIGGLYLEPVQREPGLPTVVFINGGAANWYEFFLDPRNAPGLAQYLAQKVPILLISIPGNYRHGGWAESADRRAPAYLLDRDLPESEVRVRDAIFTFSLISDGVARLIEQATSGPVLISGHSTGGEIQFILRDRLASRLRGRSLGWGTGGPASLRHEWQTTGASEANRSEGAMEMPDLTRRRFRTPKEYGRGYVGPLNPVWAPTKEETAAEWLRLEARRRPNFKQPIQDLEHGGDTQLRSQMEAQIRSLVSGSNLPVTLEAVLADLFSTTRVPLDGYRRMIWTTTTNDDGHWDPDPARARELTIANDFRKRNPNAAIRVLVFDVPMSHYGHIERPRQLAGGLLEAIRWVAAEPAPSSAAR
jgi:hypothetical protein